MKPKLIAGLLLFLAVDVRANDTTPVTHSFDLGTPRPGPQLTLSIHDASSRRPLAARFSILLEGDEYQPEWIDGQGIRFKSIHRTKRQEFTVLYARGSGPVVVGLPAGARNIEVVATRGFEYVPARVAGRVEQERLSIDVPMNRWSNLEEQGWIAVDEHLHYDRLDPVVDATWLAI